MDHGVRLLGGGAVPHSVGMDGSSAPRSVSPFSLDAFGNRQSFGLIADTGAWDRAGMNPDSRPRIYDASGFEVAPDDLGDTAWRTSVDGLRSEDPWAIPFTGGFLKSGRTAEGSAWPGSGLEGRPRGLAKEVGPNGALARVI